MKQRVRSKENFNRAQNMVLKDKFNFSQEDFCRQLSAFLSDFLVVESLSVQAVAGSNNLVICINAKSVKPSRTVV